MCVATVSNCDEAKEATWIKIYIYTYICININKYIYIYIFPPSELAGPIWSPFKVRHPEDTRMGLAPGPNGLVLRADRTKESGRGAGAGGVLLLGAAFT